MRWVCEILIEREQSWRAADSYWIRIDKCLETCGLFHLSGSLLVCLPICHFVSVSLSVCLSLSKDYHIETDSNIMHTSCVPKNLTHSRNDGNPKIKQMVTKNIPSSGFVITNYPLNQKKKKKKKKEKSFSPREQGQAMNLIGRRPASTRTARYG